MKPEQAYREAYRRTHKLLRRVFGPIGTWTRGLDCVILERGQLLPFLGLKAMQDKRIDWVKDDLKYLFPHAWVTVNVQSGVYSTLYMSRFPFPPGIKGGSMSDKKRAEAITSGGVRAAIVNIPQEAEIIKVLASVTHGIADFV